MAELRFPDNFEQNKWIESELSHLKRELRAEGKSEATIKKYIRDTKYYLEFVCMLTGKADNCGDWDVMQKYREHLAATFELSSSNSMMAGVNCYFRLSGRSDLKLQSFKVQRGVFRPDTLELTKEEYLRLLNTACETGNERLCLIMQTLASTGIRISELPFITPESLKLRRARVSLKGKTRNVILPATLCLRLSEYAERRNITSGSVFVTKAGRPVDRSNILHDMKRLCRKADVCPDKVFPHNFRHLFAVTYYNSEKDLGHLADILGHSNINTTRIYTAEGESTLAAAIENLGLL